MMQARSMYKLFSGTKIDDCELQFYFSGHLFFSEPNKAGANFR